MKKCQAAGASGIAGCLYNCVIINNHAGDEGGGIFIENGSVGDVINCVIANNTSDSSCGGLFLGDWNGWSCIQNNIIIGSMKAEFHNFIKNKVHYWQRLIISYKKKVQRLLKVMTQQLKMTI